MRSKITEKTNNIIHCIKDPYELLYDDKCFIKEVINQNEFDIKDIIEDLQKHNLHDFAYNIVANIVIYDVTYNKNTIDLKDKNKIFLSRTLTFILNNLFNSYYKKENIIKFIDIITKFSDNIKLDSNHINRILYIYNYIPYNNRQELLNTILKHLLYNKDSIRVYGMLVDDLHENELYRLYLYGLDFNNYRINIDKNKLKKYIIDEFKHLNCDSDKFKLLKKLKNNFENIVNIKDIKTI